MTHASINGGTAQAATEARVSAQDNNHNHPLRCPRCDSPNTKFCYYNNYSLSQPRHFCKACKRYWTRGGTLRSVPIGGGCRKNNRVKKKPPPGMRMAAAVAKFSNTNATVLTNNNGLISSQTHNATVFNAFRSTASAPVPLDLTSNTEIPYGTASALDLSEFGRGFSINYQGEVEYELTLVQQLQMNPPIMPTTMNENAAQSGSPTSLNKKASLLVSSLKQPRKMDYCPALLPYEGLNDSMFGPGMLKGVNSEDHINVIIKDSNSDQREFPTSANINLLQNYNSLLYWNNTAIGSGGGWPDQVLGGSMGEIMSAANIP